MGRQAYLTRIAFGRSSFQPSQGATQTSEYIQLPASVQDILPEAQEANPNRYIQLYDERGNPINPRAHEHERRLREAQNDVLASIGVVERRKSPSEHLPGSYEERLQQLDDEDMAGNAVALASTLGENFCTWWIGSIRERILTFRVQDAIPLAQVVPSECNISGRALIYGGFPARLLSTFSVQAGIYLAHVLRPLERLVLATRASKVRAFLRRWKIVPSTCLRLSLEFLFYPLAYHAALQRLGIIPARPLFPPWRAFIPISDQSPLLPFSLHYNASASATDFLKAALTSPFVFICLGHFYERWVYSAVYEVIEATIIRPRNPDIPSPDDGAKDRTTAILGLRRRSPALVRSAINTLLVAIGWGESGASSGTVDQAPRPTHRIELREGQTIEVGGRQVTNVNRLELPVARQGSPDEVALLRVHDLAASDIPLARRSAPASPTASQASHNDNDDPRIRITSREGIVEMEVRLPPHVLFSHTEVAETGPPAPNERDVASPNTARTPETRAYHRVTQLSTEPSQMIGAICKAQIVNWAILPLRLVTLRLVASHYLARHQVYAGPHRVVKPLPTLSDLTWASVGVQLSRVALCGALDFAIDLGLWGCQYIAVAWLGTNAFGWGTL